MTPAKNKRGPGRPRGFDEISALDAATRCFWSLGYARASIGILSQAMSMPRASLYAEYGDKDGLFLAAIEHYASTRSGKVTRFLKGQGDAAAEVYAFFGAMIELVTSDPATPGCLIACVLPEAATVHPKFQTLLAEKTDRLEALLFDCLRASDSVSTEDDLKAKASVLGATARGLAISARAGVPAHRLRSAAAMAARLVCTPALRH